MLRSGGLWFEVNLVKKLMGPHLEGKKLGMVAYSCHLSTGRKLKIGELWSSCPRQKATPYLQKKGWKHGSVIDTCLASVGP
jgi:hypothetical protein